MGLNWKKISMRISIYFNLNGKIKATSSQAQLVNDLLQRFYSNLFVNFPISSKWRLFILLYQSWCHCPAMRDVLGCTNYADEVSNHFPVKRILDKAHTSPRVNYDQRNINSRLFGTVYPIYYVHAIVAYIASILVEENIRSQRKKIANQNGPIFAKVRIATSAAPFLCVMLTVFDHQR